MMSDLADALDGKFEEATEEQPDNRAEEAEDKSTEGQSEDKPTVDDPPEQPKGDKEVTPPVTEDDPKIAAFKAQALDERRKRQELEAELRELKKPQETKAPDVLDDPEGFTKSLKDSQEQMSFTIRAELSADFMKQQHNDYDQREAEFYELAKESPELRAQLRAAANPARFAYDTATKHARLKALENVDDMEAKLRAEIEQKVRSEFETKEKARLAKTANITPSLASETSAPVGSDTVEPDLPLEDILK